MRNRASAEVGRQLREFQFEHGFEALPAEVALGRAVQSVADDHVECRDRLGAGARGGGGGEVRLDKTCEF